MSMKKRSARNLALTSLSLVSAFSFCSEVLAEAGVFDSGIPAGWISEGTTGTSGADGVVTLAPIGGSQYGWVSTAPDALGILAPLQVGIGLGGETNGSTLTSSVLSATAGDHLRFSFNFVTSDGKADDTGDNTGFLFSDYAWAELLDSTNTSVALLFTARTAPAGTSAIPGLGMPSIAATITPPTVNIIPGAPDWQPLGVVSSGNCFATGCGYTRWVDADYTIPATGDYFLKFGVANWSDQEFDTGLAFDGITVGQIPFGIPEPAALALLGIGLAGLVATRRRKQDA